jgi:hypothetical protein
VAERKLYKVRLYNTSWGDSWYEHHYVEADNHKDAADAAYSKYNESRLLRAEVTHVPFSEIHKNGDLSITEHKGDGTEFFESLRQVDHRWARITEGPGVWFLVAMIGFIAGVIAANLPT